MAATATHLTDTATPRLGTASVLSASITTVGRSRGTRESRESSDTGDQPAHHHLYQGRTEACREGLCPKYQKAMSLLGKRWTGLVLRVLLDGPSRFGDFLIRIHGISDPILSERLKELESQGLVARRVWADTPVRVEYALTPKGEGLRDVLLLLHRWAETWETDVEDHSCHEPADHEL